MTYLGLGIDAGGTYTDAVIVDMDHGYIVGANKALTTPQRPAVGIDQALAGLDAEVLSRVNLASMATTFATNAIVQDRGAEAGLVLIGYDDIPPTIPKNATVVSVAGGHTVTGEDKDPLNIAEIAERLAPFVEELEAVAVAGFFSVRNPDHEIRAAEFIREFFGLPVVRGHRLSMRLDAMKRATTAWWNARLIPIISNLIQDIGQVLTARGVQAPLMVVRGDGTMMSAATALERPVDTLLSGPAASILGAKQISGCKDALIVDMGGTTSDMAALVGGNVAIDPQGAHVGKWQTHVEAAKVRTIGVGGDSFIRLTRDRQLRVGPWRVTPLCVLGERYPQVIAMLEQIRNMSLKRQPAGIQPCSFYVSGDTHGNGALPAYMDAGLVSEYLVCKAEAHRFANWKLDELEKKGQVTRSALTPTDLQVAMGRYAFGNQQAAKLGMQIIAGALQMEESALVKTVEDEIGSRLCMEAISLVGDPGDEVLCDIPQRWYHRPQNEKPSIGLKLMVNLTAPVIGIGAPAHAYLPNIFEHLNTQCIVPEGYEVAVAIGAVVGMVDVSFSAKIIPSESGKYILHTPVGREVTDTEKTAVSLGRNRLETMAQERMGRDGVQQPLLDFSIERKAATSHGGEDIHLETLLTLRATGRPDVECRIGTMGEDSPFVNEHSAN